MIDINKKYRTRDGREVRIYATDSDGTKKPIHGAVKEKTGWYMLAWSKNGIVSNVDRNLDLIEVRPRHKRTVWLTFVGDGFRCYETELDAQANHLMSKLAIIKVDLDFEEGEGL